MSLSLKTQKLSDGTPLLTLAGSLDLQTLERFRREMKRLISEAHPRIIVDLDGLAYIDSSGLGILVGGLARQREHQGDLVLVLSNERIRRIFDITKLSNVFTILPTLQAYRSHPAGEESLRVPSTLP